MSTTHSGRLLVPRNYGVPSLHDLAIQQGRIVRYGGACRVHWTVLHHLFVCSTLIEEMSIAEDEPFGRPALYALLHDGEEIATSDVPSQWKTEEHGRQVQPLQDRICEAYAGGQPTAEERAYVKRVDLLALAGEQYDIAPPDSAKHSGMKWYAYNGWRNEWMQRARAITQQVHEAAPSWHHTMDGLNSPLVLWYLRELDRFGVLNPWAEDLRIISVHEIAAHRTSEKTASV